ncbi:MAG: hypothetical protein AB1656_00735 [Candidatus Omnitrophota bacterium]
MKKHCIKYSILLAGMAIFAVYQIGSIGEEINRAEDLKAYIQTTLATFVSYELSYSCISYYPPVSDKSRVENMKNAISEYQRIVKERTENTLSKEDENKWKYISNENFIELIRDQEKILNGFQIDSAHIISAKNGMMRLDKYWTDKKPNYQSFIFDGSEGICLENDKIIKSDGNTRMWMEPTSGGGFGVNLNRFVQNGFSIVEFDSATKKLRINSDIYYPKTHYFEFTLLDENPAYWKQCDNINKGVVISRVLCDHFKEISGMLVPETVVMQKHGGLQENGFIDLLKMTLSEARVNDVLFAEDFFSIEPKENMEVENRMR